MVWIIETEIADCDSVTQFTLKPPIISRLVQGGLEVQFLKTMALGLFALQLCLMLLVIEGADLLTTCRLASTKCLQYFLNP